MDKDKLVVSDADPLIQLVTSDHLNLLSNLYNVVISESVFEGTHYYDDLPDNIEIAKAAKSWLAVKEVWNKSELGQMRRNQKPEERRQNVGCSD